MAARVTAHIAEVLFNDITASPTSITGAGVSQHLAEILIRADAGDVRVTQHVVEALILPDPDGGHGDTTGSRAKTFGYST